MRNNAEKEVEKNPPIKNCEQKKKKKKNPPIKNCEHATPGCRAHAVLMLIVGRRLAMGKLSSILAQTKQEYPITVCARG